MATSRGSGEPLVDLDHALTQVEQVPKVERIERRLNRRSQVVVAVSLIIALLSMAWSTYNGIQIAQNEARVALSEEGLRSLREANEDLARQGLPTIPEPKPGEGIDMNALAHAAAAIVAGDPRFRELQDPEIQGAEVQDAENQDPEIQDPEIDGEDTNDPEPFDDPDSNDPDPTDDPDPFDDPDPNDPEIQDPEVDDPDPGVDSFTFEYLGISYTCTDPEGDGNYGCSPSMGG